MPPATSTNTCAPTIMIVEERPGANHSRRAAKAGGVATGRGCPPLLCYWQAPATNPDAIHDDNAANCLALAHGAENLLHSCAYLGLAPVTAAKQDQAWAFCASKPAAADSPGSFGGGQKGALAKSRG
jgi:hypothetical protein